VLLGPADVVRSRAVDVLRRAGGRAGHIFNLGHGVPPDASVENLQLLVEAVHSWVPANVG
jgi:uroporphyrinogen decarboxylase